jgi:hypothetical protein
MDSFDDLLRRTRLEELKDARRYVGLYAQALSTLGLFLGVSLESDIEVDTILDNGLVMPVHTVGWVKPALSISIKGVVFARGENGRPGIRFGATLLLYVDGRLVVLETGESYFEVEYLPEHSRWRIIGWFADEYGEWSQFRTR